MCRRKFDPSLLRNWSQMWQYILFPLWLATCSSRTCLYMNDLEQPGKVHLKGPLSSVPEAICFLETCPVKAASEANLASQPCHEQLNTALTTCTALRCLLRSAVVANEALHMVPHGMSQWHIRLKLFGVGYGSVTCSNGGRSR